MNELTEEQAENQELENSRVNQELVCLFGNEIVDQAELIDIADLNISDDITRCISKGVVQLKKLKGNTDSQRALINEMSQGEKLILCMWIMEMDLLDKLQAKNLNKN